MAGALVSSESEAETTFFLQTLKEWLPKPVKFMTIDFSSRIESGVKAVFPEVTIQKCIFHAIQLLLRGLIKELTKIKYERYLPHIKEWNQLRRISIDVEKSEECEPKLDLQFTDTAYAWKIYQDLRSCLTKNGPREIERKLSQFFLTPHFRNWKGKETFLQKYEDIFIKSKFKFSEKALKYVIPKTCKAWRGAIRKLREEIETTKSQFNKIKYLILMNPKNMEPYHRKKLRKYLKIFPWLRSYRKIIVRFYYQFRLPLKKRSSFNFLTQLLSEKSHTWLKSAIATLIENQEQVFEFKHIYASNPKIKNVKSIKVVNESINKALHQLFQTQHGMRTLENIRMRVSHRLDCPIFISPETIEQFNYQAKLIRS
ncbi:MAG: hypothetical protein ACTSRT_21775 [Promethearchaeota archaeon]